MFCRYQRLSIVCKAAKLLLVDAEILDHYTFRKMAFCATLRALHVRLSFWFALQIFIIKVMYEQFTPLPQMRF